MGAKPSKGTPAIDALVSAGVTHAVHAYEHDPSHASFGLEAAEKLGVEPARVFKTLMVSSTSGNAEYIAIVPVAKQLDLKAVAAAVGEKAVAMTDPKVAERLSGYVVGGISPFGQKKKLATVLDDSASAYDTIHVSAGRRGLEVEVAPADLVSVAGAVVRGVSR